ncbi:hypothetical protein GOV09_05530 [Candidatus Woesearchaeota archaeon]|nr:hypothetical protein [Candidatus Woesearchaeota archaeon]
MIHYEPKPKPQQEDYFLLHVDTVLDNAQRIIDRTSKTIEREEQHLRTMKEKYKR